MEKLSFTIVLDPSAPQDQMRFVHEGREIGRIINLAVEESRRSLFQLANGLAQSFAADEIEQHRRRLWSVPDDFTGTVNDWIHRQSLLLGMSITDGMATGIAFQRRFFRLPFGARAAHRKKLKRKHRR